MSAVCDQLNSLIEAMGGWNGTLQGMENQATVLYQQAKATLTACQSDCDDEQQSFDVHSNALTIIKNAHAAMIAAQATAQNVYNAHCTS